ncbi:amidase [Actinoalloteichus fjordicus]|uniref:Amidase, Asp-tRNAAsn/Glu-tRNAGln amidotransferase A subunit n=1 Tax=Actinoalloteichus fjordicus TaxID=1612552 RepID=A0AAC9LBZ4_9PSEU|nr:amidase, Asp-tRNAAsn/Glu-tRNAGln amidotransferase A subunit [Actinoalloteichus fjordicus]
MLGSDRPSTRRGRRWRAATAIALAVGMTVPAAAQAETHPPGPPRNPAPEVVGVGVHELSTMLAERQTTSAALVEAYLRRIDAYEEAYDDQPGLHAVITVNPRATAQARRLDAERRSGRVRGPLHGIPIVIKDNHDTGDLPTSNGSLALRELRPPDDATQVRLLREAGAIILAKTNLHEFAMNITTVSSLGGQTRNPYDQQRHPGGSSGGTGAAVAAAFAPVGMGSDTCGSIRIPAAHNALVGLRPTLGLSSRAGVAPLSSTQDTVGPLGLSVRDVALVLDATAGHDPDDPVTEAAVGRVPDTYLSTLNDRALAGARIGLFTDYFGVTPEEQPTTDLVRAAARDMAARGAETVELGPQPEILAAAGAANVVRDEFERDLDAYLAAPGTRAPRSLARLEPPRNLVTLADIATSGLVTPSVLSTLRNWVDSPELPHPEYEERLRQREVLHARITALMTAHDLDVILYPTITAPATPVGTSQSYANCRLAAYSGLPALTVPAGLTADGLPVGVELLGRAFDEPTLLGIGHAYEQATRHRIPPASTPELTPA